MSATHHELPGADLDLIRPPIIPAAIARRMAARCADCGDGIALTAAVSDPLCARCRSLDVAISRAMAVDAYRSVPRPVEIARHGSRRPFGLGVGEIDSCDLVQTMRHEESVDRDARLCRRMTWGFAAIEGLLLLAAAAMR